ncbi:Disulfide bond formation protein C [compost metagenome]
MAFILATISIISSIFFATMLEFKPGILCWIQIVLMLTLLICTGLLNKYESKWTTRVSLVVSVMGTSVSIYHLLKQKLNETAVPSQCIIGKSVCSEEYINLFGFISIPALALLSFLLITFLLIPQREN